MGATVRGIDTVRIWDARMGVLRAYKNGRGHMAVDVSIGKVLVRLWLTKWFYKPFYISDKIVKKSFSFMCFSVYRLRVNPRRLWVGFGFKEEEVYRYLFDFSMAPLSGKRKSR